MIGNFGKTIRFSVSSKKVLTFKNYSETVAGRWSVHNVQRKLPRSEFLGPELMVVTMEVVLDANLGVKPKTMRAKINKCVRNGAVAFLVVGGTPISKNKFKIKQVNNVFDEVLPNGKIAKITMSLTFEEYV